MSTIEITLYDADDTKRLLAMMAAGQEVDLGNELKKLPEHTLKTLSVCGMGKQCWSANMTEDELETVGVDCDVLFEDLLGPRKSFNLARALDILRTVHASAGYEEINITDLESAIAASDIYHDTVEINGWSEPDIESVDPY